MKPFRGKPTVVFTSSPFTELKKRIPKNMRAALCTDDNIAKVYQKELQDLQKYGNVEVLTFPATERTKTLLSIGKLADSLQERKFGRKDTLIIAFGGGIVGDTVGFLASMYLRGVPYIQVPTTLLAMVDSSIGGKTGVNTKYGKNMLGGFYDPEAIIISPLFLRSLPEREISNGLAEMVKHAVLDNAAHLEELENSLPQVFSRNEKMLASLIKKSIQVKLRHVITDARETKGIRSFLNFGHTVGHAVEKASQYRIPHGAAISIGMVLESDIAENAYGFSGKKDLVRILQKCRLPVELPKNIRKRDLKKFMIQDKKNEQAKIVFALPKALGKMAIVFNSEF